MSSASPVPIVTAPQGLPGLGHLVPLLRDPLDFLSSLPRYGDLVRIGIGPFTAVVVCDPELLRHMLRHDRIFDKGGPFIERTREVVGDGLGTCPYSQHRRLRRLLQPAFHPTRIAGYASVMTPRIAQLVESWQDGQTVDFIRQLHALTSGITAATLLTESVPKPTLDQMIKDADVIFDCMVRRAFMPSPLLRLPIVGNRAYLHAITNLRGTLAQLIDARRDAGVDKGDLLSALITSRDDRGGKLSDIEIIDQVITFFLGGTQTTANTVGWALSMLNQHPDVAERFHTEVDSILKGRPASYEDLPRLPVTTRIVIETLRLWPTLWFLTRTITTDTELGEYVLPAGTNIFYSAYIIHHRADLYPDPDRFDPDRWDPAITNTPPHRVFFSFGDGARKCIADTFALTMATMILATIGARWQVHPISGNDNRPALSSVLRPRKLCMRVTARTPSARRSGHYEFDFYS
ncbi:cytochrome P450 [Nocardia brasiliensis]|uniref:cytochrome P450 n=1 Tax=Nocardia brasiliensis TaxID=37326 RepID=UPI0004A74802|nr:cytochrome P450 [Nocardia brasiliensis]